MNTHADATLVTRVVQRYVSRTEVAPSFEQIDDAVPLSTYETERLVQRLVETERLRLEWRDVGHSALPVYTVA